MSHPCEIKIIGGKFRSRKITFPELPDLRPTPNRIRETLFDWLQQDAVNARCLDLFAGSGALGFEALSRGASSVVFVEKDRKAIAALKRNAQALGVQSIEYLETDSMSWLNKTNPSTPFDLIFLDPPFSQEWLQPCLDRLCTPDWLSPQGWLYIESSQPLDKLTLPQQLEIYRQKKAGQVYYGLVRYLTNP